MLLASGKFEGKRSFQIVLSNPDYAQWYIAVHPNLREGREFKRLIDVFDGKPLIKQCHCCGRPAKKASVYRQNFDFMFWCEDCNPYNNGAKSGALTLVTTYQEALHHIDARCGGSRDWKRKTIKWLALAKGLPDRVSAKAAEDFFS